MISIFLFSSDNGDSSTKKSDGLIISITKAFVGHNIDKKKQNKIINKYVLLVRKGAHFTIYFILGLSLISLIKEYRIINVKSIIIALIIAILYAISDEIHQLFIPGREGKILDVFIDGTGSTIGIYLYYIFYKIRRNKNEQKKAIS